MSATIAVERHGACPRCADEGMIAWHATGCPFQGPRDHTTPCQWCRRPTWRVDGYCCDRHRERSHVAMDRAARNIDRSPLAVSLDALRRLHRTGAST